MYFWTITCRMFLFFLSRSDGQRSKKAAAQSGFVSSCAAALPLWSRLPILYLRRTTCWKYMYIFLIFLACCPSSPSTMGCVPVGVM